MARIAILAAVIVLSVVGNYFYRQATHSDDQPRSDPAPITKCVTKDGETYYSDIPPNLNCSSSKVVDVSTRPERSETSTVPTTRALKFSCDGREYCSQMTSCDEAQFFLENCPNTKMDGDNDGIPCEREWCG